jgi:hypothetical protein
MRASKDEVVRACHPYPADRFAPSHPRQEPDTRLIHYASYETNFLRHMKKRCPNVEQAAMLDQLMTSAVYLLSIIYPQVW